MDQTLPATGKIQLARKCIDWDSTVLLLFMNSVWPRPCWLILPQDPAVR